MPATHRLVRQLTLLFPPLRQQKFGAPVPPRVSASAPRGTISTGKDADFVVWDPEAEITVGEDWKVEHKHKLTPYHGMKMKGKIVATYLRGEKIYSSSDERGKYSHTTTGPLGPTVDPCCASSAHVGRYT